MPIDQDVLYKFLGGRLKTRRARAGITQIDLAKQVNLSRTSIANIEAGQQNAPLHILYDICLILQIQPSELFPSLEEIYQSPIEFAEVIAQLMESEGSEKAAKKLRDLVRNKTTENLSDVKTQD